MAATFALEDLFRRIDAKDTARFLEFLSADVSFRFGNAPPVAGHAAVAQAVDGFFASVRALRHRLVDTWQRRDSLVCQGEVTYTRHDGSEITLPFANIFRLRDGLVHEYLIYADVAPLYASG
jgi:ketosteroid isomerase-like protein